jgi:hypothetical protein
MGNAVRAEGRVARQRGGRAWFAAVAAEFAPCPCLSVAVAQGAVSDFDRGSDWAQAAFAGAAAGAALSGRCGGWVVVGVRGMVCDTSPGVVALAAARAACGFEPPPTLAALAEELVPQGHRLSAAEMAGTLLTGRVAG